jgi:hypothetical protein
MQINFIYDSSCNAAPAAFKTALQTGANIIDSAITNPITVNIQVGWGENAGTLVDSTAVGTGAPQPNGATVTYAQLVNALTATASSNNCSYITANLPKTDPTGGSGQWTLYTAQAAALNLPVQNSNTVNGTTVDGSMGFATGIDWGYTRTNLGANQIDFIGTVTHEITHVLGRVSAPTGPMSQQYGVNDLYSYASPGTLQITTGNAGGYYSINGGATNIGNLDGSPTGDPADWTVVTDDNGGSANGVAGTFSFIDLQVMQALGYKMAPAYQIAGATSVDNPTPATTSVNEGAHDLITVQTLGVTAGTSVNYSISGIGASRLMSGKLTGTVTIGADGTGTIDLGVANDYHTDGSTTATVTIGSNLASTSVSVDDTSLSPQTPTVFNLTTLTATVHATSANAAITGGAGLYTVVFSGKLANYTLSQTSTGSVVTDNTGVDGTDTLTNIQRLQFADTKVAIDINGNAGTTAKILGAVFGAAAVSNATYEGIGLSYLDGGMKYADLMQLALVAAGATTSTAVVNLLWSNLFGTAPTAAQAAPYVAMMDNGSYTAGALGVLAADTSINTANINLVGLQHTGIPYA